MGYLITTVLILLGLFIARSGRGTGEGGIVSGIVGLVFILIGVIVFIVSVTLTILKYHG